MGKASRRKREAPGPVAPSPQPAPSDARAETGLTQTVRGDRLVPWMTPALLAVLAVAALFRVAYFFQYRSGSVFFALPFLDASIYDEWARRIAAGEWSPPEPFYFAPGYPYALAVLYRWISSSIPAVYVVQFALGILNIVLIHRLAALAFGRAAGFAAAVLAALYASFPFLEAKIMSPTLALTLLMLALIVIESASRSAGRWRWAAGGAVMGATSLVRPETLIAAPFLLLWIHRWGRPSGGDRARWRVRPGREALIASALLAAGWAAAISPAAMHNVRSGGGSTLISSQGGITFYQSNNARARGLYVFLSNEGFSGAPERQAQEEKELAEKATGRPLDRSEVSSYWFGLGLDFIRDHPGRFLWLLGMKLLRFVGSYEYSTEYIIYVERETVPLLWLPFVPFALIVALAVPSLVRALVPARGGSPGAGREMNPAQGLLVTILAANLVTVLTFYVSSRYRLPSAPPLLALAGATLASVLAAARRGNRAHAAAIAAVVAVIFLVSHFEKDSSAVIQEANVHYNSGNLWAARKDHERAVAEYERAIAMDATRYEFFHNKGNSLRDLGRFADAAGSYRGAAEILERKAGSSKAAQEARSRFRSQLALERTREGQMLVDAGDLPAARRAYQRAEEIRPDDFEVQLALGRIASRLDDRQAAILHLDRAIALKPTSDAARAERAKL